MNSAQTAVKFRQGLKTFFKAGLFPDFRAQNYAALVAAGKTDAQIIAKAGRTNTRVKAGAIALAGGAAQSADADCGCQQ